MSHACSLCKAINVKGKNLTKFVDIEERLVTSAVCRSQSFPPIKVFHSGGILQESINDYFYREVWTNESAFQEKTLEEILEKDII